MLKTHLDMVMQRKKIVNRDLLYVCVCYNYFCATTYRYWHIVVYCGEWYNVWHGMARQVAVCYGMYV